MIVSNLERLEARDVEHPDANGVKVKVMISPKEGWDGWVMREFEVAEGGNTPRHQHDWQHINYIIEGEGELFLNGETHGIREGGYAYVPSGAEHQFKNIGAGTLRFICIVPEHGHK